MKVYEDVDTLPNQTKERFMILVRTQTYLWYRPGEPIHQKWC